MVSARHNSIHHLRTRTRGIQHWCCHICSCNDEINEGRAQQLAGLIALDVCQVCIRPASRGRSASIQGIHVHRLKHGDEEAAVSIQCLLPVHANVLSWAVCLANPSIEVPQHHHSPPCCKPLQVLLQLSIGRLPDCLRLGHVRHVHRTNVHLARSATALHHQPDCL